MKCKLLHLMVFLLFILKPLITNAQTDQIHINKIEVNGTTYNSGSTITLNLGMTATFKINYTVSKGTPSYQNSGITAKVYAKRLTGPSFLVSSDSQTYPNEIYQSKTYDMTFAIQNVSLLIEKNNTGELSMVYEYGTSNANSNKFTLNFVQPSITNNTISGSITTGYLQQGSLITGTTPNTPFGTYKYYWQRKNPGGDWFNINNGTINTKDYAPLASQNTYNYKLRRAVQSNQQAIGTNYSNEVDVFVGIGNNVIVENLAYVGSTLRRSLLGSYPKGGNNTYTYQWQELTNNTWNNISGATLIDYAPTNLNVGQVLRRIVRSNGIPESISNSITINDLKIFGNLITVETFDANKGDLDDQKVIAGQKPVYNRLVTHKGGVLRSGTGTPITIQWQSKTEGGNWLDISGATNEIYTINTPILENTQFRRVVTSAFIPTSESNIITVNVTSYPPIDNNTISFDPSNSDHILGTIATGGNNDYQYVWALDVHPDDSIGEIIYLNSSTSPETFLSDYIDTIPVSSDEYHITRYVISDGTWHRSNTLIYSLSEGIIQGKKAISTAFTKKENNQEVVAAVNNNELIFNFKNYKNTQAEIHLINLSNGRSEKIINANIKEDKAIQSWVFPLQYLPGIYIYKIIFNDGSVDSGKVIKK